MGGKEQQDQGGGDALVAVASPRTKVMEEP